MLLSLNGGLRDPEGDSRRAVFRTLGDCGRESGEQWFSVSVGVASGTEPVTLLGVASAMPLEYVFRDDAKIGRGSPVTGVGTMDEPGPERFSGSVEPEPWGFGRSETPFCTPGVDAGVAARESWEICRCIC